ncbi:hypothetical protein EDD11_007619 [Mortierella claussenii]|nr:hypothetical protein EDD11_007619 [Mortierella claussenii]
MPIFTKSTLDKQSVELPGTRTEGATGHYRHVDYVDGLVDNIRKAPEVKTIYDLFERSVRLFGDKQYLGHRVIINKDTRQYGHYVWETYAEIRQRVEAFGSGLLYLSQSVLGDDPEQLSRWSLGIWAVNRPEWSISELSCSYFNLISVALYDTLGSDAVDYVMNHADIRVVVASGNHVASLLKAAEKSPGLKVVISMDPLEESIRQQHNIEGNVRVYDFAEIEVLGVQHPQKHRPPKESDIASLCYTSGTTGMPKGAIMTQKNFVAIVGVDAEYMTLSPRDTVISFLPLAHILGRVIDMICTSSGARIGYFQGNMLALVEDCQELKPTCVPAVPRLLNRIYAKIVASTVGAPGMVGMLFRRAVATKLANLHAGKGPHHWFWDRLLFKKVRMALGGNVEYIVTGSAPTAKEVHDFMRITFGCVVSEGYGATESMGPALINMPDEYISGHAGSPRAGCEVKLVDVSEMSYFSTDKPYPRGEICIRGAHVIQGYHKDEQSTQEAIDSEGWLHTGDIGFVDNRGCFSIIDRKKNIFKLSQGEYVAPEKIENVFTARCNLFLQVYVHGESLESTLIAIAVPDPETFLPFAMGITGIKVEQDDQVGMEKLCQDEKVKAAFVKELEKAGKAGGLKGFELIKRVHLTMEAFSVENGMMSHTFKIRRPQARDHYREHITAMYADINASQQTPKS